MTEKLSICLKCGSMGNQEKSPSTKSIFWGDDDDDDDDDEAMAATACKCKVAPH
jgi:hypothetical protein